MPATFARKVMGEQWARDATCATVAARPKIKTVVVPAYNLDAWKLAVTHFPVAQDSVQERWLYLVCIVAGRAPRARYSTPGVWTADAIAAARIANWAPSLDKICGRAAALAEIQTSPEIIASHWNTYLSPCLLYPCQLVTPHRRTLAASRLAGPCNWAPWFLLPGLGVLFGIAGAPRCPEAIIEATGIVSMLWEEPWAPGSFGRRTRTWAQVTAFSSGNLPSWPTQGARLARRTAVAIQSVENAGTLLERRNLRGAGSAIYDACFALSRAEQIIAWLQRKSESRGWWPTNGAEWRALRAAPSYNAAYYTLKILAGNKRGSVGTRPASVRRAFPRRCSSCSAHDVPWVWTTPGEGHAGTGWCALCYPGEGPGRGWRMTQNPEEDTQTPTGRNVVPNMQGLNQTSPYGPCPLCSRGELTSQHLLHWCAAVAFAWTDVRPLDAPDTLVDALLGPEEHLNIATRTLHQIAHVAGSLGGRASLQPRDAGGRIARAVRLYATGRADGSTCVVSPTQAFGLEDGACPVWLSCHSHGCPTCAVSPQGLGTASLWTNAFSHDLAGSADRLVPHTASARPAGDVLLTLYSDETTGLWPLPDGHAAPSTPWCPPHARCPLTWPLLAGMCKGVTAVGW